MKRSHPSSSMVGSLTKVWHFILGIMMVLMILHDATTERLVSSPQQTTDPFDGSQENSEEETVSETVIGVIGYRTELECDIQPTAINDQLLLVLWYKDGHNSPIYTYDARGASSLSRATHYSDEKVFGNRAVLKVPPGGGISGHKVLDPVEGLMAKLVVQELRLEDEGVYKCRTDFKKSPTKNYRMTLNIMVPPMKPVINDKNGRKLTTKLGPFKLGEEVVATCTTWGGSPFPRLTWWREHTLVDDSYEVINGKTTNTLHLHGVQRNDHNQVFTCQAVNNNQSIPVSTSLRLDILFPPLTISILRDRELAFSAGREEALHCQCRGSQPAPIFRWFVGEVELDSSERGMTMSIELETATTTAILHYLPKAEHHGKYFSCRATNEYFPEHPVEVGYIINVQYVPTAVLSYGPSLNPKNIKEGDDVYFECHVKSNPQIYSVTWRHNGKFVDEDLARGIIIGNQTLVLQAVARPYAGLYTCVASNQEGDGESNAQYLNIKFAPQCRQDQRVVYGAARTSTALVSCFVDANPNPDQFRWQFQPTPKNSEGIGRKNVGLVDINRKDFTVEHDHSVLSYIPDNSDYGTAFCWAENSVGVQREPCRFNLVQESPPEPLRKCLLKNVTWEDFSIECASGFDGGHEAQYHVEVYEEGNHFLRNFTSLEPRFRILQLKPGQSYGLLLYASNALGMSATRRLNASTMPLGDKRTAETRSQMSPPAEVVAETESGKGQEGLERHSANPGLALLPIVAILAGVAVGLTSVALGVILLVHNSRTDEVMETDEGFAISTATTDNDPKTGPSRYDALYTKVPRDEVGLQDHQLSFTASPSAEQQYSTLSPNMLREKNGKGQPYSLAIRQPLSNRLHMVNGSSTSGVEFVGPIQSIPNGQLQDSPHLQGYPQHHIYSLNHFDDQDTTPPLSSPELQTQPSQSSPSPKTVHFQLQTRLNLESTEPSFMKNGPSPPRAKGCRREERCCVHANGLAEATAHDLEDEPPPLPPPSQYAATSPVMSTQDYPFNKKQQHYVNEAPSGLQEPVLEKSFVTFCSPNLETKSWDVVNATRL